MSSGLVHMLASRSALCSLGQASTRVQPIAVGCNLVGQVRHRHVVYIHGTTKCKNPYTNNSAVFEMKLPMKTERLAARDVLKELYSSGKDAVQTAESENRFLARGPEEHIPLKPLEEGEVGLVAPAARADWMEDHTLINKRMKKVWVPKDSPTLATFGCIRVRATGNDKLDVEQFLKDVSRLMKALGLPRKRMLGVADQTKEYHVIKQLSGLKKEARVVSYALETYTRYVDLPKFPGFYADIVLMTLRKHVPAGVDFIVDVVDGGELGAAFATKGMRATAAKMAKKAHKGSGTLKYRGDA